MNGVWTFVFLTAMVLLMPIGGVMMLQIPRHGMLIGHTIVTIKRLHVVADGGNGLPMSAQGPEVLCITTAGKTMSVSVCVARLDFKTW